MIIFPAIDLFDKKAVRLYQGSYDAMTVYSEHPEEIAADFLSCGASAIHIVDLEGARSGETPNLDIAVRIKEKSGLFCEIGGGIRSMEIIERYLSAGLDRVILGTAALQDERLLRAAVERYGEQIAVGADLRDGLLAVRGWTETSEVTADAFMKKMQEIGVGTVICTDISRDGAMRGTNRALYQQLSRQYDLRITASGGVSSMEDIRALKKLDLYAAIVGKAYYTGAIDLKEAVRLAEHT